MPRFVDGGTFVLMVDHLCTNAPCTNDGALYYSRDSTKDGSIIKSTYFPLVLRMDPSLNPRTNDGSFHVLVMDHCTNGGQFMYQCI